MFCLDVGCLHVGPELYCFLAIWGFTRFPWKPFSFNSIDAYIYLFDFCSVQYLPN